jgi:drug/metabolite transporter (DMT)-like permease
MTEDASRHSFLHPNILIPFVLCALIWGSTWFAIKDQLAAAPHGWSVTWRMGTAAIGMALLVMLRRQSFGLDSAGHKFAATFGIIQFCGNLNLLYRAEVHLTSGLVAVMFALLMLPNAVLARIFLGQQVTRGFIAGTAVAVAGIALLLVHEARMAPAGGMVGLGIVLTAASILAASAANVMQAGEAARRQPLLPLLFWAMLYGALADFALAWAMEGPPVLPLDPRYLGGVAFLGIMGSVVTFPLYIGLIRELGAGRAAYNGVAVPIIAMLWSTLFENYRWSALTVGGAALALAGMVLALRARSPSR